MRRRIDRKAARPVLSICIPTYNRSELLRQLLAELDQPGYLPFPIEVVVVDNASENPDYEAISEYQPQHVTFRYYRRPANVGVVRNLGGCYRLARGEFCVHLSDDDHLIPDELARIVGTMQAHPGIGATFAAWQTVDRRTGAISEKTSFEDLTVYPNFPQLLAERLPGWSLFIPENAVMRTDIVARATFPPAVQHFAFSLLRLLLQFKAVRFSSKAFYQLVIETSDDPANNLRASSRYQFDGWSALARGYGLFYYRATGRRLHPIKAGRDEMPYLLLLRNSIYEAHSDGRLAEAMETLDYLESITAAELVVPDYVRTVRLYGAIDQMRLAVEILPDAPILALVGLTPEIEQLVRDGLHNVRSSLALERVYPPPGLDVENRAFLTLTDEERDRIINDEGALPGYVFSMESLKVAFGF
jgi:glycosyltransferase involved in cell wall biosynthesis